MIASSATPIPITQNIRYGVSSPSDCDIGPPSVGPIAQPIPKTVSYTPMIFPEIPFLVLLRIISKVSGKNILNPNPIRTSAIPKVMIESATTDIASPADTANTAAINV